MKDIHDGLAHATRLMQGPWITPICRGLHDVNDARFRGEEANRFENKLNLVPEGQF
jgi:hypothetical protein